MNLSTRDYNFTLIFNPVINIGLMIIELFALEILLQFTPFINYHLKHVSFFGEEELFTKKTV